MSWINNVFDPSHPIAGPSELKRVEDDTSLFLSGQIFRFTVQVDRQVA